MNTQTGFETRNRERAQAHVSPTFAPAPYNQSGEPRAVKPLASVAHKAQKYGGRPGRAGHNGIHPAAPSPHAWADGVFAAGPEATRCAAAGQALTRQALGTHAATPEATSCAAGSPSAQRGLTRRQACAALGALALGGAAALLSGCGQDEQDGSSLVTDAVPREFAQVSETGTTESADASQASADSSASSSSPEAEVPEQGDVTLTRASGATCTVRSADERRATSDSTNEEFPGRHVCFLTFDDGPSTNTQRILGILNDFGVKATWFVKGSCGHLDELPGIWAQGNQVAIHTYSHEYEQVYASVDAYWTDLHQCGDAIAEQIGHAPTLVRFPGGSVNDFNAAVRGQIIEQMSETGYHYFDWNVSCGDGADHTTDELVGYTTSEADGCHSCCVLMHDSEAKDTTVDALPRIVQYFIDNGFEFDVLLSDTFGYHF